VFDFKANTNFPLVSVIILNWNQKMLLNDCLESVLSTDYPEMEVIVSDNGSTDGSVDLVKKKFPDIILIENNSNLGFCVGNNVAIKQAKGDIIVLLNNDTLVDGEWVKEIVDAMNQPNVGVVGCKLIFAGTNLIQSLGYVLDLFGYYINQGLLDENIEQLESSTVDVDYVSGAALAIRRDIINEVGLLDPRFYAYFEDVDWCYRVKTIGYRVVVAQKAVVHHFGSVSWNSSAFKKVYLTERNRLLFLFKHLSGFDLLKALTANPLKATLRLITTKLRERSLTVDLLSKKTGRSYEHKKQKKIHRLLKAALNWVSAKFLAYLSIPLIILVFHKK